MISHKHRECLDYYQQLTNLMTAFQTLTAEKEDLRIQLSDLKRSKEEDERILKTTPTKEKNDAGDDEVKSSRSGVSIDDNADEEKEEFQGQLQRLKGEMREIGLTLLGCKDELAAERTTKQLLYDENESLRKTLEAHSLLDTAKFPPQQQQQQRLIESSSSLTLSSADVNSDIK